MGKENYTTNLEIHKILIRLLKLFLTEIDKGDILLKFLQTGYIINLIGWLKNKEKKFTN